LNWRHGIGRGIDLQKVLDQKIFEGALWIRRFVLFSCRGSRGGCACLRF